jgi:carbon-monoxide dehydrogenase large subunit
MVNRLEDPRLLVGNGEYVADLDTAGVLHVVLVRSVHPHARIASIDTSAALAMPGVVDVVTGAMLGDRNGPMRHPQWRPNPALLRLLNPLANPQDILLLATDRVRYPGEPIAAVVATNPYLAHDAAELVAVEYEPLDVVVDAEAALSETAPLLYEGWGTNVATSFTVTKGDVDAAFAAADKVVKDRFTYGRQTGAPMEPRGVLARPDRRSGGVVVWSSTQNPHWVRDELCGLMHLTRDQVRVVAPDVGGGFGVKGIVYPEELLVPLLAQRLRTPVRWIETRSEQFAVALHSRDHWHDIELALRGDGTILGVRDRFVANVGATSILPFVESYNTAAHLQGPYRVPTMLVQGTAVVTNKAPSAPVRGAGRPEAVYAMERIIDLAARELGLDPALIRQINTLRADEMPYDIGISYRDGHPAVLDSGDYLGCLTHVLEQIDYQGFRRRQVDERARGRYLGIGLAGYVEGTGIGPIEQARVRVEPDGYVTVTIALPSQGQSHATTFAMLAAAQLGISHTKVRLVQGDTLAIPDGDATIASRAAVTAGNAIDVAARRVRDRALNAAAELLEVAASDLEIRDGLVSVVGTPTKSISLGDIAKALRNPPAAIVMGGATPTNRPLQGWEPGLEALGSFAPQTVTWANGMHGAIVEVDPDTGFIKVERYVVVHDCGRVIDPVVVEGQIAGGVVQGLGGAMLEELVYDANGQLVTGSFADYLLPRATDTPPIEVFHHESPSPLNPLGIKGVGEGGTIPTGAVIAGAVEDALSPFGVHVTRCPLTPDGVRQLLRDAGRPALTADGHAS